MITFQFRRILLASLPFWLSGACWASATYSPYLPVPAPASGGIPLIELSTLVQGSDGTFYAESPNGDGVVVSISPAGTFTTLHGFNGNDGESPTGALVFGPDGDLYGVTDRGFSSNEGGVIYRLSTSGSFTQVHGLDPVAEASDLHGGLVLASDGNFYGLASSGGANGLGAIYRVSPSGTFAIVHSFTAAEGTAFQSPLVVGPDGNLWSTSGGGAGQCGPSGNQCGYVYKVTLAGVLSNVYQFTGGTDGGYGAVDGGNALGGLVLGSDGNLYGMTLNGIGPAPKGTIFKVTPSGTLTTLHTFTGSDGDQPRAALAQGPDGNLYGTTRTGGTSNDGVVFSISPTGSYTVLHNFAGSDGANPTASLILAQDGSLYGTASAGGALGYGALYKIIFNSVLAAPTNLTAQAGNSQVVLSWTVVSGAASYDIYQAGSAGAESSTPVASGVTSTSFTVTGLTNGSPYFFTVTAANGATSSAASNEATATPVAAPTVTLTTSPASVTIGTDATLTWSSTDAAACTASGATVSTQWSGAQATSGSKLVTTSAAGDFTFTLTCSGAGGTGSAMTTLTVTAAVQAATETPTVSPAAGTYTSAQNVTLTDMSVGAAIYYTTDGSQPTSSSSRYSMPISISSTTTLRVLAIASGASPSAVVSATYTINEPTPPSVLSGRSGGGALGGVEVVGLLLLAISRMWRLRPSRAYFSIVTVAISAITLSQSAHAQEFQPDFSRLYLGLRAGSSDYRTTASDLDAAFAAVGLTKTSASVERHRFIDAVYLGVPFYGPLSIELGYADLGEYHVSVQTSAPQATLSAQTTVSTLRPAGRGETLQLAAPIDLSRWIAIEPRVGLLLLQSKQEIATPTEMYSDNRHDVGFAGGLALLFRPIRSLYIGGGVDCFGAGLKCDVLTYTGQVEFHFGLQRQ